MPKKKELKDNQFRIIKIGREALFEFIYEQLITNQTEFFEIDDITKIVSHFDINLDTGELICLIRNEDGENEHLQLPENIDLSKLMKHMKNTTTTLYKANRYVELSLEEIRQIQTESDNLK